MLPQSFLFISGFDSHQHLFVTFKYLLPFLGTMKRGITIGSLLFAVFLLGCGMVQEGALQPVDQEAIEQEQSTATEDSSPGAGDESPAAEFSSCMANADCREGLLCIDNECKTFADLYRYDCTDRCNFNSVTVSTSDGETYTFAKGQGSYTAAGALEWKVTPVPDYCPDENIVVPLTIFKKTTGRILGEQLLALHAGETSGAITHPTVSRIAFTVTLDSINEVCP